jgi:hypothetical protein
MKTISDKKLVSDEPNSMTIIGITAGVGGGLLMFVLGALICVCRKVQQQKSLLEGSVISMLIGDPLKSQLIQC